MLCRESRLGAGSNPILWQLFDALSRRFAPRQGRKFWPTLKGRFQLSLTLWLFCLVMFFSLFVSIFHFWCLGTGDSCTPRMWNCIALCSDTASARPRGCFRSCAEWRGGFDLCSTRAAGEVMKTPNLAWWKWSHFGCLFMLILVRFLIGSRNLFELRSNFSRSCFDWAYEEFQSTRGWCRDCWCCCGPGWPGDEPKPLDGLLLVVSKLKRVSKLWRPCAMPPHCWSRRQCRCCNRYARVFCQELIIDIDVVCLCAMIFHLFEFSLCFGGTGQSFCLWCRKKAKQPKPASHFSRQAAIWTNFSDCSKGVLQILNCGRRPNSFLYVHERLRQDKVLRNVWRHRRNVNPLRQEWCSRLRHSSCP